MTSCSTILALGMMPLLLFIFSGAYGTELPVPFETIGKYLVCLSLFFFLFDLNQNFLFQYKIKKCLRNYFTCQQDGRH